MSKFWMLPEDVIELLPEHAAQIETLRRQFLDNLAGWGYQQVMPPLVEFLDSLLAGSENLDLQTFKLTDQQSGRMMGVRADITPQIARIDAHRLPTNDIARFAYCAEVLRTRSESTQPRRNPLVIGAELYGVKNFSGDIEIMSLLLDSMMKLGIQESVLDIGHAGIFAGLVELHGLNSIQQKALQDVLIGLRRPDLKAWKDSGYLSPECIEDIRFLVDAPLQTDSIAALKQQFFARHALLDKAVFELQSAYERLRTFFPEQSISIDTNSVGTYGYHNGLLFALYAPGHYDAIARGGRYDGLGEVYGKARPATGFSADLFTLGQIMMGQGAQGTIAGVVKTQKMPTTTEEFLAASAQRADGTIIRFTHEETP